MNSAIARAAFSFFIPGGILFLAALYWLRAGVPLNWSPVITQLYPAAVLSAGVLIGWRFNRSRLVFALLLLALADRALLHIGADGAISGKLDKIVYYSTAILLPLNFALLAVIRERGMVTARGLWRIGFILAQPLLLWLVCYKQGLNICDYLDYRLIAASFLNHAPLPQPALLAFGIAFVTAIAMFAKRRGVMEGGLFWALMFAALALTSKPGPLSTAYFTTAGLVLVIAVIEASYGMAFRDELTGLPGRRALNEALLKLGNRYAIAMLDIDFFKKFNDRYGHDIGDQVLRMVASKVAKVSGGGKAFRYGGEEFTVVFPGKNADEALTHLEQLRSAVESADFYIRSADRPSKRPKNPKAAGAPAKKTSVTISIGVSDRKARQMSPQDVIEAADKALYRAKNAGRNRVST